MMQNSKCDVVDIFFKNNVVNNIDESSSQNNLEIEEINSSDESSISFVDVINNNTNNLIIDSKLLLKSGKYNSYTIDCKREAVKRAQDGQQIMQISIDMGIPTKNIRRWIQKGTNRKEGGGRKIIDPIMEQKLYNYCINYCNAHHKPVPRIVIQKMALKLISQEKCNFKASKGWLEKFLNRFDLQQYMKKLRLQNSNINKERQIQNQDDLASSQSNQQLNNKDLVEQQENILELENQNYQQDKIKQQLSPCKISNNVNIKNLKINSDISQQSLIIDN